MAEPTVRFATKSSYAEAALRRAIRAGTIRPGERLRLEHLAARLGVSATPLREAARHLVADGLLEGSPHRGVWVARPSPEQARELYLVLAALEGLAARLGAELVTAKEVTEIGRIHRRATTAVRRGRTAELRELNRDFHRALYDASGLRMLQELIAKLHAKVHWDTLSIIPGRPQQTVVEHAAILAALRAGDAAEVGRLTSQHVGSVADSVAAYLRDQAGASAS